MGIRSTLAAIVTLSVLILGAFFIERSSGAGFGSFLATLVFQHEPNSLICTIAAWGSVISALFSLAIAMALFQPDEDDENRPPVPIISILFFLVLSLALFWFVFRCAVLPVENLTDEPLAEAESSLEDDLLGTDDLSVMDGLAGETLNEPLPVLDSVQAREVEIRSPPPQVAHFATPVQWPFKYPLIRQSGYAGSASMDAALDNLFPMNDPAGDVRRMLCGKAWVAITGASSEEGPQARNRRRSHYRAEIAAQRAGVWLDRHADSCQRPIVLAVDLGQHADTSAPSTGDGETTGRQREILGVWRAISAGSERPTAAEAAAEMRAFLADRSNSRALLGDRRYEATPRVFAAPHGD